MAERDIHLDTRSGAPICRSQEALPRLTLDPEMVTCLACRCLPQFEVRVEGRKQRRERDRRR